MNLTDLWNKLKGMLGGVQQARQDQGQAVQDWQQNVANLAPSVHTSPLAPLQQGLTDIGTMAQNAGSQVKPVYQRLLDMMKGQ